MKNLLQFVLDLGICFCVFLDNNVWEGDTAAVARRKSRTASVVNFNVLNVAMR